jgi:hypothetical protein
VGGVSECESVSNAKEDGNGSHLLYHTLVLRELILTTQKLSGWPAPLQRDDAQDDFYLATARHTA